MPFTPMIKTLQSSDGTPIYAEAIGNPHKPCFILVHGIHMSCLVFDGLFDCPRLLDRAFLVRYDLRGHGRSGKPEDPVAYSSSLFADDYAAVIRGFGIKRPVYVGWQVSYGAMIPCDICAHLESDLPAGLVYLAGPPSIGAGVESCLTPLAIELLRGNAVSDDANTFRNTVCDFVDACFNDPAAIEIKEKMIYLGPAFLQTPQVTGNLMRRHQDPTKLMEAGGNGLPLLVINGGADKLVSGDMVVKATKPYFKDFQVHTVEGGSHIPFYEHREEVVEVLIRFLHRVHGVP